MKLIVLNLPRSLSESGLAELFQKHGDVKAYNLVMDATSGASKGFGFIEMSSEQDAAAAIKALNGSKLGEKKIRVKISEQKK